MNVFICLRTYMKYGDLSAEILKLQHVGAGSFLSFEVLGFGCVHSGESTFFHPILVQLPVMPCQCGMCKAVGFHPHLLLFSMISFYSEHSKISIYPELLNFYKFNGKMSSKHQARL